MNRFIRHVKLAGFSGLMIAVVYLILDSPDGTFLFSMATAYAGLILLAITLLIGPLNLIQKKQNPVSSYLRRDIGIWAGVVSVAHVIIGLQVHMGGRFWIYFVHDFESGQLPSIRFDAFGLANHTGLLATIIIIVLLVLSNNTSLKKLGVVKWKSLQRLSYLLFALVMGHGFIYQLLEKRPMPFILAVLIVFLVVLGVQWKGTRLHTNR